MKVIFFSSTKLVSREHLETESGQESTRCATKPSTVQVGEREKRKLEIKKSIFFGRRKGEEGKKEEDICST